MRVTGGVLGGRPLRSPRGQGVRPTADRVRESLFATAGTFEGARVLDGFAGTGALGIEALSRGAISAVFVERSPRVLAVLRENLDTLDLSDRAEIQRGDVAKVVRRFAETAPAFDWVFLDPPYKTGQADTRRALDALSQCSRLNPAGRVVVESSRHHPLEFPPSFRVVDERRYGDTVVVYLSLVNPPGPAD